ncbi:MAG TPA: hypothetical protein VMZ52_02495, partial [Bryobacteraceae bacterium]|nr:hypothetical protein [Bryobacteraceae bacterium]
MRSRSFAKTILKTGSTLCLAALTVTTVVAIVGDGIDNGAKFELDGNASVGATHDWNQVYADKLNNTNTAGALAIAFTTDIVDKGDNILSGGGTKDPLPFSGWAWKQNSTTTVQDKDDIQHAYAAAYKLGNGHTGIFFGADRFSNSGDAQMGFWFVQDPNVGINNVAKGGNTGGFNGIHMEGDLLIVAHFVNGGSVPEIELFKWVGSAETGTIQPIGGVNVNLCNPASGNLPGICAITNSGAVGSTWTIVEKSSDSPKLTGLFMEGGIDLTNALGGSPCFNKFFAETRSSASATSTLSDFTVPVPFSLCTVDVTKACATGAVQTAADGHNFAHYTFTGKVFSPDGVVYDPKVKDTFPTGAFNTKLSAGSDPAAAAACTPDADNSCTINIPATGGLTGGEAGGQPYSGSFDMAAPLPASDTNNPAGTNPNRVFASAAPISGGSQTVTSGSAKAWSPYDATGQACNISVSSNLTLGKGCAVNIVQNTSATALNLQVQTEIKLCSTVPVSAGGVQVKNITLNDNVIGPIATNITLNAPTGSTPNCVYFYPKYTPASATCTAADGRCAFSDIVTVVNNQTNKVDCSTNAGALGCPVNDFNSPVQAPSPASATCRVCPFNACSGS